MPRSGDRHEYTHTAGEANEEETNTHAEREREHTRETELGERSQWPISGRAAVLLLRETERERESESPRAERETERERFSPPLSLVLRLVSRRTAMAL